MRSTRLIPRLFTVLIFLVSSTGLGYSYEALRSREQSSYLISEPFTLGASKVQLLFDKQCLGEFNLSFKAEGDSHNFSGEGKIAFSIAGKTYAPQIKMEAAFNELDQLGGSFITVTLPDLKLVFGTLGIDPLEFRFRMMQEQDKRFSVKIPGPIELRKFGASKFAIRYGFLSQIKDGLPKADLGLEFQDSKDKPCNLVENSPPNLTPLIFRAVQLTSKANFKQPLPFQPGDSSFEIF